MNKFLRSFKKDIVNHVENKYGKERAKEIWSETEKIYHRFLSETPYIGGSKNIMAHNLYQALVLFAYYEATERDLSVDEMDAAINQAFCESHRYLGRFINLNKLGRPAVWLLYKWIKSIKNSRINIAAINGTILGGLR